MQSYMIDLQNVKLTYPQANQPTLDIPSFRINPGKKVFVYGPSGSGKTTLLEVLSGVLSPQEGQVIVAGTNLRTISAAQRDAFRAKNLGYIFQSFNLVPYLNVEENIELPCQLRGESRSQYEAYLFHLVERLSLGEFLHQSVTQLSVGQQQRVAVARALLGKPNLLLADEPTSSLDFDNRERFLKLLFALAQETGTTILFVSHDRALESLFDESIAFLQLNRGTKRGDAQ